MSADALQCELRAALDAAALGARIVMDVYGTEFLVDYKSHDDPVTQADRRANDAIVAALGRAFPNDAICAEEGSPRDGSEMAARSGRCWFVDPLDGTREFVDRNGEFCVMIGLAIDGEARLGVVNAPTIGRTFAGVVGAGATESLHDGVAVRSLRVPPPPANARDATMVVSRSHRGRLTTLLARELGITRIAQCGSVGLKVAKVASGETNLYVHTGGGAKLWDGCAPEAIARAAGAVVTDGSGQPLRYDAPRLGLDRGIVVAAPTLHAIVIRAMENLD